MKVSAWVAAILLIIFAVAGCEASSDHAAALSPANDGTVPVSRPIPTVPGSVNGVYEPQMSYAAAARFGALTGTKPNVIVCYSSWGERFQTETADVAQAHGAHLLVQLQPNGVSLSSIAAGQSDQYLRSYAQAVKAFGYPVILSFAHEMNGNWYSWGTGHTTPAQFIAAWRHVVQVFRAEGATNVTWLWTVNAVTAGETDVASWWPGAQWVTWVGIDGYYYQSSDTFSSVFDTTVAEVRRFTKAPVLVAETAVGPGPEAGSQVQGLFAGIRADRLLGEVWFDVAQDGGLYHQDWHLADDPAALAAFRAALGG
jgi:mannan endo-1,4-beta-mannosidase